MNELIRQHRSEMLDPDLVNNEFAPGWAFAVPKSFRDALDIVWDVRQENKVRRETWTQGQNYRFSQGDTLYDHQAVYENSAWEDGHKHITIALQILSAQPAMLSSFTPGLVEFAVLRKESSGLALVRTARYTTSQAEFVRLLRTGSFQDRHHSDL